VPVVCVTFATGAGVCECNSFCNGTAYFAFCQFRLCEVRILVPLYFMADFLLRVFHQPYYKNGVSFVACVHVFYFVMNVLNLLTGGYA
jgi:hypothetical protein